MRRTLTRLVTDAVKSCEKACVLASSSAEVMMTVYGSRIWHPKAAISCTRVCSGFESPLMFPSPRASVHSLNSTKEQ